jgi:hypothetical protein
MRWRPSLSLMHLLFAVRGFFLLPDYRDFLRLTILPVSDALRAHHDLGRSRSAFHFSKVA